MWKVPVSVPGFGNANYPCICPISPRHGHAFCEKHCKMAQAAGYPSELRRFLKKCGVPDADKFAGLFFLMYLGLIFCKLITYQLYCYNNNMALMNNNNDNNIK